MQAAAVSEEVRLVRSRFWGHACYLLIVTAPALVKPVFIYCYVLVAPVMACHLVYVGSKYQSEETAKWCLACRVFGFVLAFGTMVFWLWYFADSKVPLPR